MRCEISSSVGARSPTLARSVRPVKSSTNSRITDGLGISGLSTVRVRSEALLGLGGLAVVIASSFESGVLLAAWVLASSGSARFDLRGGRRDPMNGARNRSENLRREGGRRYVLNPARSERYIWPVSMPTIATATELSGRLIANCDHLMSVRIARTNGVAYL